MEQIREAKNGKDKLSVLIEDWKFRLPMASAILSVLYPDEFTVYDIRVCKQLKKFKNIDGRKFDALYCGYKEYIEEVKNCTPSELGLRDKDRWLWGKDFKDQLDKDIERNFGR